ncbi:MAG: hypothetical protein FJ288_09695 [Planctomycetes bacterium]|nr:hypothetical protein [Planctomycetota bacterium]
MAVICIAGTQAGVGKTAVAEMLLAHLPGWSAARVRVADEMTEADAALLGDAPHRLLSAEAAGADGDARRLHAAGARQAQVLLAQPRGLEDGLAAMLSGTAAGADLLVEGNAFLWARQADVAVMVIGPGPSGSGVGRVRASARELLGKIAIWAWNARAGTDMSGFFEFPLALARMGFKGAVSNRSEFHHVNPLDAAHAGNAPFIAAVGQALERCRARRESDDFLRRAGFGA